MLGIDLSRKQKSLIYSSASVITLVALAILSSIALKGIDPTMNWIMKNPVTFVFLSVVVPVALIPVYSQSDDIFVQRAKQFGFSGIMLGLPSLIISIFSFTVAEPGFPQNALFWFAKAITSVSMFSIVTAVFFREKAKQA